MAVPISSAANVRSQVTRPAAAARGSRRAAAAPRPRPNAAVQPDLTTAPVNQRQLAQAQAQNSKDQDRARILDRVDALVRGMESLAQRISADGLSSSQRSAARSRFNELEQQINRIDGIVGGEGREAQGQKALRQSSPAGATGMPDHGSPAEVTRVVRDRVEAGRRQVASRRAEALQTVTQQLRTVPDMEPREVAAAAQAAANGIQARGADAILLAASGNLLDTNA